MCFLTSFEIQSRFTIQNVFRHDLTSFPCDHDPYSSIISTQIPKYNAKRSFSLTCATTRLNFCLLSSYEIQSQFSNHIVFTQDLTNLPCDHKPDSSNTSAQPPKYKAKRPV
ncbi:uncharacterized protein G2W53_040328 [Senna tora]|uniref:Uncharacterized protein n=1 Tax=Senna tora TaxID=362788 RepID=A0A834SQX2_9FABA|nr:uncharacterized protein G2W53_040328 [Senna tora]